MLNPLFGIPIAMLALNFPIPSQIHVKIFPHLNHYAPQGKDRDPTQVRLQSPGSCTIGAGMAEVAADSGHRISTVPRLDLLLTNSALTSAIWIRCTQEIQVLRKGASENYRYSGAIYAHATRTGPELIEVGPLNDYLKGVVPSEMPSEWPQEALKAQAVAARTYAVFHIMLNKSPEEISGRFYDVDDTVFYQAYTGRGSWTAETEEAIDETGSGILLYQGKVIQAYFSADAGGYTEDANHVWPVQAPYCVGKAELYDDGASDDEGRWGLWTNTLTWNQVNRKLISSGFIGASQRVVDARVDVANRYLSGRAKAVTLVFQDKSEAEVDGQEFRRIFALKSTLFQFGLTSSGSLEIRGRGFGHGVGLSQFGARELARLAGWDYTRILGFYYTGVELH